MGSTRVLAIDDEQIILDSLVRILEPEGYVVEVTRRSRVGLDWALTKPYDLVLTDIRMPDLGGMRILRDIKRAKPTLPVVLFTGYATVRSAVSAMKLGATDYLEKPFTPDGLVTAVHLALERSRASKPEEQRPVHHEEILKVLRRAASDAAFVAELFYGGADALEGYQLTPAEKLAILTADVPWIEAAVGKLGPVERRWLDQRLAAEVW